MAIDIFLTGNAVNAVVPLVDKSGNALSITSVDYQLLDETDAVLVARTTLAGFTPNATAVTITLPAAVNTLLSTDTRKARILQLFCLDSNGNTKELTYLYGIEQSDPLIAGVNSFAGWAQAQLIALDVPNTPSWDAASDDQKIQALIEARNHIVRLNFSLLNSNVNYAQDQLAYIPQGNYITNFIASSGLFLFTGNLELLNSSQFLALPVRFIRALQLAQIAEADFILGGDATGGRREAGIILESIGDTKQMFRTAKPLDLPCSKRALGYISYFVTFAKHVGRG